MTQQAIEIIQEEKLVVNYHTCVLCGSSISDLGNGIMAHICNPKLDLIARFIFNKEKK